ncbi:5'-nucleotidase family protein [Actinobaculum suis]|uniref:5'-nucleotidase family protein n=1 Tax=Actinobaculum suis TaxID=1657 RepID=A0A7Z8Y8Q3_9ACTO|nr:bifunctional UDP-sugar hydrolase/5'-nucleotidase [Actinobaculum suis]VDG76033.1 5'-nucleotidase family protein [Actinobaculum suis]
MSKSIFRRGSAYITALAVVMGGATIPAYGEQKTAGVQGEGQTVSTQADTQQVGTESGNTGTEQGTAESGTGDAGSGESGSGDAGSAQTSTTKIDIAVISDFHGHIETAAHLAGQINKLREANPGNTFFVGNGDLVGGSAYVSSIANDQPTLDILNAMGLQGSSSGNHEFDQGYNDYRDRIKKEANFPFVHANVEGARPGDFAPYFMLKTEDGIRVAFVGTVTADMPNLVSASGIRGLTFTDPVEATNRVAAQLKDGDESNGEADIVVGLMHENHEVAQKVGADVDVQVAGHTHLLAETTTESGAPVIEPGEFGRNFGHIVLEWDNEKKELKSVTAENKTVYDVEKKAFTEPDVIDQDIEALYQKAKAQAEELGAQPVGTISGIANRGTNDRNTNDTGANRGTESSVGNLIAEGFYQYSLGMEKKADFGIINPGGLRADLDPNGDGQITYQESYSVQPFGNSYATIDLTGAQVYTMLEQQWKDAEDAARPLLRLGLSYNTTYLYDHEGEPGNRVKAVYVDGKLVPRDESQTYTIASNQFLLDGGDGFSVFTEGKNYADTGIVDNVAFNEFLKANPDFQVSYRQSSIGINGEDKLQPGKEATINLASLSMTSSEPVTEKVDLYLNNTKVGTAEVDNTVTPHIDDTGKATITFTVPADAPFESTLRVVAGDADLTIPVTVGEQTAQTDTNTAGTDTAGTDTTGTDPAGTDPAGTEKPGADKPASEKPVGVWAVGNDARGIFYVNAWGQGKADRTVNYGNPNDEIIFGDWDGDGIDTPLVRRGNVFLGTNGFSGVAQFEFAYGNAGDEVLVGDWNGDGKDTVAVVRGNQVFVRNSLTSGVADAVYAYGNPTDTLIAGDWNGDGKDTLAAVRGNIFYVQSKLEDTKAPLEFTYGTAGDRVIVGDWNGTGKDGVGVVRGNQFFLKNKLVTGVADEVFAYGNAKDVSVVGDWDGDGIDTPAVDRR